MANIKQPKSAVLRGEDFTPILRGRKPKWDSSIYLEYSMHHGAKTHMRGIRTPEWKFMIDFANDGRLELYHLKEDPDETINLAQSRDSKHIDIRHNLMSQVRDHMQTVDDPLLATLESPNPAKNP